MIALDLEKYGKLGWWLERLSPRLAMKQRELMYSQMRKRSAKLKSKADTRGAPEQVRTRRGGGWG